MGGGLPAEIWRQIMDIAHEGKAPLALPGHDAAASWPVNAMSEPQVSALPWSPGVCLRRRLQAASRTPRVDRIIETLPWMAGCSTPPQVPVPCTCTGRRSQRAPHSAGNSGRRSPQQTGRIKVRRRLRSIRPIVSTKISWRKRWRKAKAQMRRASQPRHACEGRAAARA